MFYRFDSLDLALEAFMESSDEWDSVIDFPVIKRRTRHLADPGLRLGVCSSSRRVPRVEAVAHAVYRTIFVSV